jgi:hypothetical protein
MLNINKAFKNNRLMKALTGLIIAEFKLPEPVFPKVLYESRLSLTEKEKLVAVEKTHYRIALLNYFISKFTPLVTSELLFLIRKIGF